MTRYFLSGAASLILLSSFVSCSNKTGTYGETVMYPTVDEIAALEKGWGLEPRRVKQRLRPLRPGESYDPSAESAPVRRSSTPAPAPAAPAMLAPEPEPIQNVAPATADELR